MYPCKRTKTTTINWTKTQRTRHKRRKRKKTNTKHQIHTKSKTQAPANISHTKPTSILRPKVGGDLQASLAYVDSLRVQELPDFGRCTANSSCNPPATRTPPVVRKPVPVCFRGGSGSKIFGRPPLLACFDFRTPPGGSPLRDKDKASPPPEDDLLLAYATTAEIPPPLLPLPVPTPDPAWPSFFKFSSAAPCSTTGFDVGTDEEDDEVCLSRDGGAGSGRTDMSNGAGIGLLEVLPPTAEVEQAVDPGFKSVPTGLPSPNRSPLSSADQRLPLPCPSLDGCCPIPPLDVFSPPPPPPEKLSVPEAGVRAGDIPGTKVDALDVQVPRLAHRAV